MSVVICDSPAGASALPPPEALLGAWTGSAAFVYCRDLAGTLSAVNEAFARKFGRPADQLMGKPAAGLVHHDDTKSFPRADEAVHVDALRIEVAVNSDIADQVVQVITAGARTGQIGDGKIFVTPIDHALRIRTGETDSDAL